MAEQFNKSVIGDGWGIRPFSSGLKQTTPLDIPDDCSCTWVPRTIKETGEFAYMEHKFADKKCPYHYRLCMGSV